MQNKILNLFSNEITIEEKLIGYSIIFAYVFYFTGTLYIAGSLLAWLLIMIVFLRWFVNEPSKHQYCLPVTVWVWIIGMGTMLIALLIAHANYELSWGQTLKSTIGWAKGWALLALFLVLGAITNIKPALLSRACCILASQAIIFIPLGCLGFMLGMSGDLYLSPLKIVGGPESTFQVNLFGINPETGRPRWPFFTPWAPAAGLISCLYFIICTQEKNVFWRRAGFLGSLLMCLFCQSRVGWVIFILLVPAIYLINHLKNPLVILLVGLSISSTVLIGQTFIQGVLGAYEQVRNSRPESTRVRSSLAKIAIQRWESEAPVWGHGIVEKGPKVVEHMPIGSHHTWYGLLFVKGSVGFFALALPFVTTVMYLFFNSFGQVHARRALLLTLVILAYSFFENLEILAYLYWPALLWIGMALNPLRDLHEQHTQCEDFT